MLHRKRPPLGDAPQWLSHEQINRRLDVLRTVKALLDDRSSPDHTDIEGRVRREVVRLACRALGEAEWALSQARFASVNHGGGAPVEHDVLDLVPCFNSIGPSRLKTLLRTRGPFRCVERAGKQE